MSSPVEKIGMREFRAHLPQYLMASLPVAITRHGETVGFYIPANHPHKQADLDAVKDAALKLEELLASYKINKEDIFSDFKALREKGKH